MIGEDRSRPPVQKKIRCEESFLKKPPRITFLLFLLLLLQLLLLLLLHLHTVFILDNKQNMRTKIHLPRREDLFGSWGVFPDPLPLGLKDPPPWESDPPQNQRWLNTLPVPMSLRLVSAVFAADWWVSNYCSNTPNTSNNTTENAFSGQMEVHCRHLRENTLDFLVNLTFEREKYYHF